MNILRQNDAFKTEAEWEYVKVHWQRYEETLRMLQFDDAGSGVRVLELGACAPHAFTILMKSKWPRLDITLAIMSPESSDTTVSVRDNHQREHKMLCKSFNIETDRWPFDEEQFDVVICMEILEHLILDPRFVYLEANRVLRGDGKFIVTTPNVASMESIVNVLNGRTPYRFGLYSPYGCYGRHNREYTPTEVSELGEACAFRTETLETVDVYPSAMDSGTQRWVRSLLVNTNSAANLHKQNIFYCGAKTVHPTRDLPTYLYTFDPQKHRCTISSLSVPLYVPVNSQVTCHMRVRNDSSSDWCKNDADGIQVGVQLLDAVGKVLKVDFRRVPLTKDVVKRHEWINMEFSFLSHNQKGRFILRFDMLACEHDSWFSNYVPQYKDAAIEFT